MGKYQKLIMSILTGQSDSNIRFQDLCNLLKKLEFEERIRGSHHIFRREGIIEKINLQQDRSYAKPYQVKQVRNLIIKYRLVEELCDDE